MKNNTLNISVDMRLIRNPTLLTNSIDDELVMMDDINGTYFGLNAVAKKIWELLEHSIQVKSLLESLTNIYDIEFKQCQADVYPFLNTLLEKNLVQLC